MINRVANTTSPRIAFIYLRLSNEDQRQGESGSITNQRKILHDYCNNNNIIIAHEFADDDYSGGNFNRPGFLSMIQALDRDKQVNTIITKDLSRLGRDMGESSYYAERYFPERGIRYIAVFDNFDSDSDNYLAPFQFAINDVYLRDTSKKIKTALHTMMDRGEYCFQAPYGYKKDPHDNHKLVPDEGSAYVVQRIFEMAAQGYSSRVIADALSRDNIFPPLKYRVYNEQGPNSGNSAFMSDEWNSTTVKRILANNVYRGHTLLGKTKKVSPKSEVKKPVPKDEWRVTMNTHEPLVNEETYNRAAKHIGERSTTFAKYDQVRKNLFSGMVFCASCGAPMCSCGSVYKGEREKYWYLSCLNIPKRSKKHCENGARIKYDVLIKIITDELNELLSLTDEDKEKITLAAMAEAKVSKAIIADEQRIETAKARLVAIDSMTMKLYEDMYAGRLEEKQAHRLLEKYKKESEALTALMQQFAKYQSTENDVRKTYDKFFALTERYTHIDELTQEILDTFIERIDIGPKQYPEGVKVYARSNIPYVQDVNIHYKFVGEISEISPSN